MTNVDSKLFESPNKSTAKILAQNILLFSPAQPKSLPLFEYVALAKRDECKI